MMKPDLNRRGCLIFALGTLLALAALLWLAREAPRTPEAGELPPTALENEGLAQP